MNGDTWIFLALCGALLVFLLAASFLSKNYSLDRIKSKTVGDGQHGTARWATPKEISKTYHTVPFRPRRWRKGKELPTEQGLTSAAWAAESVKAREVSCGKPPASCWKSCAVLWRESRNGNRRKNQRCFQKSKR